jgi:hypothetical protein
MLSLLPVFQKLSLGVIHNNQIKVARQVYTLSTRVKGLQTNCGFQANTNILNATVTAADCMKLAQNVTDLMQPILGHPSSYAQDKDVFQQMLNIYPTIQKACALVETSDNEEEEEEWNGEDGWYDS